MTIASATLLLSNGDRASVLLGRIGSYVANNEEMSLQCLMFLFTNAVIVTALQTRPELSSVAVVKQNLYLHCVSKKTVPVLFCE